MGRDKDADRWCHFCLEGSFEVEHWRISQEKEEVTSRRLVFLRARCMPLFTMPSKGGTQDFLKCLTTPQAASKPAAAELSCHWLKVIQYLSAYWCVFLEGETPRNIFMPHTAPEGKIINSPYFVNLPFLLWGFNLTLWSWRLFVHTWLKEVARSWLIGFGVDMRDLISLTLLFR